VVILGRGKMVMMINSEMWSTSGGEENFGFFKERESVRDARSSKKAHHRMAK
jgi:hypothetical protein